MSAVNKAIVESVNDAFAGNNIERFLDHCSEEITWTMVGKPVLKGKQDIREFMNSMGDCPTPPEMEVINIIAEGDLVAADGTMSMPNADGTIYNGAYCDIYHFRNGEIIKLTSYIVDLPSSGSE
jgi:ketosteroid isomerase-like protein